uniref:Reverse transcriptase domain-containing protein n=1 Tax=Salmo trutta TaxID=8032 RepID=A0A673ZF50_SALTR
MDHHAPIRKSTVGARPSPWIDDELGEAFSQRNMLKVLAAKSKSEIDEHNYRTLRNYAVKLNRREKKLFFNNAFIDCKNDSKKVWNTVKGLLGTSISSCPSSVEVDGRIITKPVDIANHFADFFTKKINLLSNNVNIHSSRQAIVQCIDDHIMSNKICSFSLQTVSVEEVLNLLKSLPDGKSTGYDLMDNLLLRCAAPQIAVPLRYIFNWSLEKGMFANVWKHAKLCPISKDCKEPATPANSRPISLLPTLSKILEGIVSRQIWEYMENNDLITANQHAYRKNHSTTTALVDMTDQWLNAMDNGKFVGVLFLDFSAAFDLVDHEIILTKLMHYGFKEVALNWVQSYLTDRKQSTYINGSFSSPHALNCGIPQGSCLGPLLYLIYTNDLSYALAETQATIFADDTTIYAAGQSVQQVQQALQGDLENIREWVCQNKLVLNTKKTKVML